MVKWKSSTANLCVSSHLEMGFCHSLVPSSIRDCFLFSVFFFFCSYEASIQRYFNLIQQAETKVFAHNLSTWQLKVLTTKNEHGMHWNDTVLNNISSCYVLNTIYLQRKHLDLNIILNLLRPTGQYHQGALAMDRYPGVIGESRKKPEGNEYAPLLS